MDAGEHLAYDLKEFNRATAIIGEGNGTTAGMANYYNKPWYICEEQFGKHWWTVLVRNQKPVHGKTGASWEGVGVMSDVVAGQGEWKHITDAAGVARVLAVRALQND